jgi:putative transposase
MPNERQELESLVRSHSVAQQVAIRARLVLLAADGHGNEAIARHLHLESDTVRLWRARWDSTSGPAAQRLASAPKSGRPSRFTPEQICQLVALACERPEASGRPISHWSARELAAEARHRGIVPTISRAHLRRLLQRARSAAPPDPVLAHSAPPGG